MIGKTVGIKQEQLEQQKAITDWSKDEEGYLS